MILLGFTMLFLLPQIYVDVKGVRMAKNPNGSKGHIIWACILFAFAVVNLISPLVGLVQGTGSDNFGRVFSYLLEIAIYYDYIKYATAVSKEYCQVAE